MHTPEGRLQQMERALEISQELTSATTLPSLLQQIVQAAAELTHSAASAILLLSDDAHELRFVATNLFADLLSGLPVPIDRSIAGAAFSSGAPVIVPDVSDDPRYYATIEEVCGFKAESLLAVPLQFKERCIGVLEVENKHDGQAFDPHDVKMLTALAAQATVTIENIHLVEALQDTQEALKRQADERECILESEREQRRWAEALRRASAAVGSTLEYDRVLDRILNQIHQIMPNVAANIMLIEEYIPNAPTEDLSRSTVVHVLRGHGYEKFGAQELISEIEFDIDSVPLFAHMRETRRPLAVPNVEQDDKWVYSRPEHRWIKSYAGSPILIRDRTVGFLNVNSDTAGFFSQRHADALQAFADHVAIAIENARLYHQVQQQLAERERAEKELEKHRDHLEELVTERTTALTQTNTRLEQEIIERSHAEVTLQQRNRELDAVNTVIQTLSSSLKLQDTLDMALSQTVERLGFKGGLITLLDEHTNVLSISNACGVPQALVDQFAARGLSGTLCEHVFQTVQPVSADDLRIGAPVDVQVLLDAGVLAYAGAPITYQNNVLGTVCLLDDSPHTVSDSGYGLIATLGQQIGVAVQNTRLFEAIVRERHISNTLLETAKSLSTTLRFDQLLERVLDELQHVLSYDVAMIGMLHEEHCWIAASRGITHVPTQPLVLRDHPLLQRIARERHAVVLPDVQSEPAWSTPSRAAALTSTAGPEATRSWLGIPLSVKDQVMGLLMLDSYRHSYDEAQSQLAIAFANQVALAIENSRLYEQMQTKLRERTLLYSVTAAISSTLDIDQILPYVARSLCEIMSGSSAEIYVLAEGTDLTHYPFEATRLAYHAADASAEHPYLSVGQTYVPAKYSPPTLALTQRRPTQAALGDAGLDAHIQERLHTFDAQATLILPMMIGKETLGFAQVWENQYPRHFSDSEIAAGQTLIHQAAIATYNARLVEALRRHNAELEMQNAELDAFAHTVAHDLKSPLTALIGFGNLLEKRIDKMTPETLHQNIRFMTQSGHKMNAIIDELLLLASVRKMDEVQLEPLDMGQILAEVQTRLAGMIDEHDAEIVLAGDWPAALGRKTWIEEVWTNYISNAIKYGGHPPHIEVGASKGTNGSVYFWVRDNGPGLNPEEQELLFTPFTRLHELRAEGHGLGLSIVQRIVEKLGGQVGVESAGIPGEGSTFFFTLPVAEWPPPS
ncbi:MAG: GAF domain-containing protein [Anaerolineae bacterium]|nr:GAF domain-containing protein [Anaerolineae bacterium]